MPIEIRELHIKVAVDPPTSEAGGGRDVLIAELGTDRLDAAASTGSRGHLIVGVEDVHLKAIFDGFDLV